MMLVKNSKDYIAYVEYSLNSGFCTVLQVHVVPKYDSQLNCEKIAEKLLKNYKKDAKLLYDDIEEFGNNLQKAQIRS